MLLTRVKKTQRKYRLMTSEEKTESYRAVRLVTYAVIYGRGECYPLCPRCKRAIDREYVRFCSNCGQHLGWTNYSYPRTTHTGIWRVHK